MILAKWQGESHIAGRISPANRLSKTYLLTAEFLSQKMIRRKKNVKKGIQFCLMVCGASGTGEFWGRQWLELLTAAGLAEPDPIANKCQSHSRPDHLCEHPLQ